MENHNDPGHMNCRRVNMEFQVQNNMYCICINLPSDILQGKLYQPIKLDDSIWSLGKFMMDSDC